VNKELEFWIAHRGVEQLLLVVAGGELVWDEAAGRFDPVRSSAAPPALTQTYVFTTQPLFVELGDDIRPELSDAAFRDRVTTIAAPIHGVPKEALASEDRRELRRYRRWRRAAFISLVLLLIAVGIAALVAVAQRNEAERQRDEAVALALASEARDLILNPPFRFGGVWWWAAGFGCRGSWRATRRDGMPGPVG
jgi:hypothetical protein